MLWHKHENLLIQKALSSAQIPTALEPQGLTQDDERRPDGITLFPWSNGRALAWDFTCRDTLAISYVHLTSQEAGKAAELAEKKKLDYYKDLATKITIMPVRQRPWDPGETWGSSF